MQLQGKTVLITGGSQGIGAATAQLCAAHGAFVEIADVNRQGGELVAAEICAAGGQARFEHVDVTDEAAVRVLMAGIGDRHGRLDVMICAAGVLKGAFLQPEELEVDVFESVMNINVRGAFICAKYATPLLASIGHGVIIIIASGAGVVGPSSSLAYGASKGGANGLGMTLASRLAPRGIRVNVVCPGEIVTQMKLSVVATQAVREGRDPEAAVEKARQEMGSPDGIARVLAFLASDDADYVRGTLFTR
jgi:NAD(P)-dependent dehydrogenase (short-subunit alcohol dehydrogenase family)